MSENGYIKFKCEWIKTAPLPEKRVARLNEWRARLFALGLIGAYADGIGYGNVSRRIGDSAEFIITGTATGGLPVTNAGHYTRVLSWDFARNTLKCEGPVQASSESLTHAAVYQSDIEVKAVFHVHSAKLWQALRNKKPTTSPKAEYGTPDMATEILRLMKVEQTRREKIIVMGGHEDGIISFGRDVDEAGGSLIRILKENL